RTQLVVARLRALSPGLWPAVIGLGAASVLVCMALIDKPQQQVQAEQVWGNAQAASVGVALRQMNANTQAAALNAGLVVALQANDPAVLEAAVSPLHFWDGVLGARVNPPGMTDVDAQGAVPISFSTLDMLSQ